jgi:hypothetical protein
LNNSKQGLNEAYILNKSEEAEKKEEKVESEYEEYDYEEDPEFARGEEIVE